MDWNDFIGHDQQRQWFASAIQRGRLGSTFLFVGPPATGKHTFAKLLAKSLLCHRDDPSSVDVLAPCGQCESCAQVTAATHPDLTMLKKPDDKSTIPIEMLVGPRESRMQEGLCHDIRLRPFHGRRKIAIIDDADALNQEGANCLLKTLEEPPPGSVLILIGTSLQKQLPTIRSRCQIIRFGGLSIDQAKRRLADGELDAEEAQIEEALELSGGDLQQAAMLLAEHAQTFRESLVSHLRNPVPAATDLANLVTNYTNAAGQDARYRRERLRQVFQIATEYYRKQLHEFCQADQAQGVESSLYRVDRCVTAMDQINRNANQQTLVETWAWDIQRGHALCL